MQRKKNVNTGDFSNPIAQLDQFFIDDLIGSEETGH